MRIALDAMGGDHGPRVAVEGAVQAARQGDQVILFGDQRQIAAELDRLGAGSLPITITHCPEVISMEESPALACRQKRNASIMLASQAVAEGQADALVSAGNSGATMTAALMHLRRLPGVLRPAIASLIPTAKEFCVLLDVGANVDCQPKHLLQFAVMGHVYVKHLLHRPSPRIGLLSIGEEDSKGNELTLATAELLKSAPLHCIGNVEGRDIAQGTADVIVCDGFVGNVILKFGEGLAEALVHLLKEEVKRHPLSLLGMLFFRGIGKDLKKKVDYAEYGGAPLLGVNGACIICHGGSNAKAIANAIHVAGTFVTEHINQEIERELKVLQQS